MDSKIVRFYDLLQEMQDLGVPFMVAAQTETQWLISATPMERVEDWDSMAMAMNLFMEQQRDNQEESRIIWN